MMRRMPRLAATGLALALVFSACGEAVDDQDVAQFPTVGFEVSHEATIAFPTRDVCPLYEPSGRFLLYDDWDPTVLREPDGDTLVGLITTSQSFGLEVILNVTEHTPDEGHIRYVALWDDFEVQRIDIACREGATAGSTTVVWTERNAGLHEKGTSMVTTFIEAGGVRINAENYARNIAAHLQADAG